MYSSTLILTAIATVAAAIAVPEAAPVPTAPAKLEGKLAARASTCTFTAASAASASQKACSTIVLSSIDVPAGTTLDLSDLEDNTHVIFEGTTTFGYQEWDGPLIQIEGTGIAISGASGHVIDGDGSRWWDGQGGNGGKTKPKFFAAHNLISSSITGLNILNTPVQCFSVDGAQGLTITGVTINNSAGDSEGAANTDGFDVGSSTDVTISGANVHNQDDCLAINSGTVRLLVHCFMHTSLTLADTLTRELPLPVAHASVAMD